jgi:hypothetical protein
MRISHTQLGTCQSNPTAWIRAKMGSSSSPVFGMSYDRALRLALHDFHKTQDSEAAHKYLEGIISKQQKKRKFLNAAKVGEITDNLTSYVKWFQSAGIVVVSSDFLLRDLSQNFLTLGGKISRLDLVKSGYRTVLFGDATVDWRNELRLPLIQNLIATMFARPAEEISVGFQKLNGKELETTKYSASEIIGAQKRFKALTRTVQEQSSKYKLSSL